MDRCFECLLFDNTEADGGNIFSRSLVKLDSSLEMKSCPRKIMVHHYQYVTDLLMNYIFVGMQFEGILSTLESIAISYSLTHNTGKLGVASQIVRVLSCYFL
jgi:hypothetical protein